ncbi:MAG TPA: phenylalanine--tRNA ligase subunit beta [Jiangellales bacterium]|nr:phenylalanine--tRNA ligase subunit beta [Jiangellales bacterium]
MKVSLAWVGDYVELPVGVSPQAMAQALTLKTVEVEDVVNTAAALAGVVVGAVESVRMVGSRTWVTCRTGADRTVAMATTVPTPAVGSAIAVALPGARLLNGSVESVVAAMKVGNRRSEGAVGTPGNLRLQRLFPDADPAGALDLSGLSPAVGTPLAEVIGFDDVVLEIDNKSLTNRPDLWGHYGIARELSVIYDVPLRALPTVVRPPASSALVGEVEPEVGARLAALSFELEDGNTVAPLWLRSRLARIGEATVNLAADLTKYVMFTVGQPTHAYDADRITGPLRAVAAKSAEPLRLLDGRTVGVVPGTPVIADGNGPVALAGVMGGAGSAIGPATRRMVLEAATFHPQVVRRASLQFGVRTEASARFEKALDTQRVDAAVDLFVHLLHEVAPGSSVHALQDVTLTPTMPAPVAVQLGFLAGRIGTALDVMEIEHTLRGLGFTVDVDGDRLSLTAPAWRSTGDISWPHDIVEEVARIHGYDNLPVVPLSIRLAPVRSLGSRSVERQVRQTLALRLGLQEVVTYPWVSDASLAAVGLGKTDTVRFDGAPAPDRDSLRPSLVPNLIEAAAVNLRHTSTVEIFEVGTTFHAGPYAAYGDGFEPMPRQTTRMAALLTGPDGVALFRRAKGLLGQLTHLGHLSRIEFGDGETTSWADVSARLCLYSGPTPIGTLGLLTKRSRRLAGLDAPHVACLEVDLGAVGVRPSRDNTYVPVPELPGAEFDLSVVVADNVTWAEIASSARHADPLVARVDFIDEFRGSWVRDGHRSVTLRVSVRSAEGTLTGDAIGACREAVLGALAEETGAHLRP